MPRIPPTLGPPGPPPKPASEPPSEAASGPVPEPGAAAPARPSRWRHWRWIVGLLAAPVVASHLAVVALRWVPPPTTAFMLQSPIRPVDYRWVPRERIAEVARQAVIAAEDQKFRLHGGFDFDAIGKALEHNERARRKRGASTISQQVAKNLFLWQGRSWLRKGLEVYATLLIEWTWGKDRILEVYLNIAEFGPGIYGVEAASQRFFGKPAARLSADQAARLAAVLPSPRRWRAGEPGTYVYVRSQWILRQMGYGRAPEGEPGRAAPSAVLPPAGNAAGDTRTAPAGSDPRTEPWDDAGPVGDGDETYAGEVFGEEPEEPAEPDEPPGDTGSPAPAEDEAAPPP